MTSIYKDAVEIQNACNAFALINSLARRLQEIRADAEARGDAGTVALNRHPVIIAYLDKLSSLAGIQDLGNERIMEAHDVCAQRAEDR